jgi:uncharacterized protein YbaA (DUF1428 family)
LEMMAMLPGMALALMSLQLTYGPLAVSSDLAPTPAIAAASGWYTDYTAACDSAKQQRKMLLIVFHAVEDDAARDAFERRVLTDPRVKERLHRFVIAKLPLDASIIIGGEPTRLLDHASFAEMRHRQGVAMLDFANPGTSHFSSVVSTFPFSPGLYYRVEPVLAMLDLPPGTLTQRTMIFAVRTHPEGPASTKGRFHPVLAGEAQSHSGLQARIRVQGHHSWETRFHRINARIGDGLATEVVAESWGGESLVDAAVECVRSWRQSPGHWGAVRAAHRDYGYDIRRGGNGIWYATGIFSGWRR